jgi:hypothetical protein
LKLGVVALHARNIKEEKKKPNICWLGLRIICPRGEICLPVECCFSELTLTNPTLVPSTEHARLIGCLCMYTWLKLLVFNLTLDQEFFSNIVISRLIG